MFELVISGTQCTIIRKYQGFVMDKEYILASQKNHQKWINGRWKLLILKLLLNIVTPNTHFHFRLIIFLIHTVPNVENVIQVMDCDLNDLPLNVVWTMVV